MSEVGLPDSSKPEAAELQPPAWGDGATLFAIPTDAVAQTSDDCYTPRWVFDAMGLHFDIDVAAPVGGPWHVPCDRYYTAADDGLTQPWDGLVWCNPPYSQAERWVKRWAEHDRGVLMAQVASRQSWRSLLYEAADAVYFGQVEFSRPVRQPTQIRLDCYLRRLPRRRSGTSAASRSR